MVEESKKEGFSYIFFFEKRASAILKRAFGQSCKSGRNPSFKMSCVKLLVNLRKEIEPLMQTFLCLYDKHFSFEILESIPFFALG